MVEFGKVPDKISAAVRKFVETTASSEGNSKKIDSKKEYDKLGEYLTGNKDNMNVPEQEFIHGFMLEYENDQKKIAAKKAAEEVEINVTESTKEAVKKIAKSMGDKKKIDTDAEATVLVTMLKNTKGDLNKADLEYIRNILITSGYGSLLEEKTDTDKSNNDDKSNTNNASGATGANAGTGAVSGEGRVADNPVATPPTANETPEKPSAEELPVASKPTPTPVKRSIRIYKPPKTETPAEPVASANPKTQTPTEPTKYQITEKAKAQGRALAKAILDEVNDGVADNDVIKTKLNDVAMSSAFSFVGDMIQQAGGVAKPVFSVNDWLNKLNCEDILHVMQKLQDFAGGELKLQNTSAYKNMANQITHIKAMGDRNPNKDDITNIDNAFRQLYDEINRKVQ